MIAVDGYSSCGKSTVAKALSKRLKYVYIDTGAMYRAVCLYLIENGIDVFDIEKVQSVLPEISLDFEWKDNQSHIFLNGKDVSDRIRDMDVSSLVSEVSTISEVRKMLVRQQKAMGKKKGIVMDGRDIGTVVFPDAELKIFLVAGNDIRVDRRFLELQLKGSAITREEVSHNLSHRDRIDSTRLDSPLKKAEDAIEVDNSELTEEEQLDLIYNLALEKIKK